MLRSFIDHWLPDLLLWVRGHLDPLALIETDTLGIERILIDARARAVRPGRGRWIPRLVRPLLARIDRAFAADEAARAALARARFPGERIEVPGPFEDAVAVPPANEAVQTELAGLLVTRPLWCALDVSLEQAPLIAAAHKRVSRLAHRLVLVLVPAAGTDPAALTMAMREAGFDTLLHNEGPGPSSATQILVADSALEPGLWARLSPVTFLCGTLQDGPARHPFEIAALGSALIHGPALGPYATAFRQINDAGGSLQIDAGDALPAAVEELLAPDRSAEIVLAAWDITSRSAAATNRVAETIRSALEKAGY